MMIGHVNFHRALKIQGGGIELQDKVFSFPCQWKLMIDIQSGMTKDQLSMPSMKKSQV